jgi:hypothetical protein
MEVSGELNFLLLYIQGNSHQYPLDKRLGGLRSRSRHYGEETNLAPAGNQTPVVQSVTYLYTD